MSFCHYSHFGEIYSGNFFSAPISMQITIKFTRETTYKYLFGDWIKFNFLLYMFQRLKALSCKYYYTETQTRYTFYPPCLFGEQVDSFYPRNVHLLKKKWIINKCRVKIRREYCIVDTFIREFYWNPIEKRILNY